MSKTENKVVKLIGINRFFKLQDFYRKYVVSVWFLGMLFTPVIIIALLKDVQL